MEKSFWLFKTEPETFSFDQLIKDGKTFWNGVRNFQARNYLRKIQIGDSILIYHSGDDRCIVGVAEVIREAYPDPDPTKPGEWVQVDIRPLQIFPQKVKLSEIKKNTQFSDLLLLKQSRLSVMPVSMRHFNELLHLGGVN